MAGGGGVFKTRKNIWSKIIKQNTANLDSVYCIKLLAGSQLPVVYRTYSVVHRFCAPFLDHINCFYGSL